MLELSPVVINFYEMFFLLLERIYSNIGNIHSIWKVLKVIDDCMLPICFIHFVVFPVWLIL